MRLTRITAALPTTTLRTRSPRARIASVAPAKEISHSAMQAALSAGEATYLTSAITDIVRYDCTWWLYDRESWLRVTDAELAADLDSFAVRTAGQSSIGN